MVDEALFLKSGIKKLNTKLNVIKTLQKRNIILLLDYLSKSFKLT